MATADIKLRFRENGQFRILFLSDFQEPHDAIDPRTLAGMEAVLQAEQPDLVFLCGDNCDGPNILSADMLRNYLQRILKPITQRSIPWCHVNGNHDYDAHVTADEQLPFTPPFPAA